MARVHPSLVVVSRLQTRGSIGASQTMDHTLGSVVAVRVDRVDQDGDLHCSTQVSLHLEARAVVTWLGRASLSRRQNRIGQSIEPGNRRLRRMRSRL
jgi:hypothetical protein